jgi:rhamnulokinase
MSTSAEIASTQASPCCLVFDLGGGSARAMLAQLEGGAIRLTELHRFTGYQTRLADGPALDIPALLSGIDAGLEAAAAAGGVDSIGVDGWGVDFVLLDEHGKLLDQPRTHRHPRGQHGMAALTASELERIAESTGIQLLPIVSLFHLCDWSKTHPELARKAARFLMIADLVALHLSGVAACERTLARTSGLLSAKTGDWDRAMLALTGLPDHVFGPLVAPGAALGQLSPALQSRTGLSAARVVAVAGHDTASAALCLAPAKDEAFLVCGSWILVGAEIADGSMPLDVQKQGFGLEGGVEGRGLLVRSLQGMHLLRGLRDAWARRTGTEPSFPDIAEAADRANPAAPAINPSDPLFVDAVDMIEALRAHCPKLNHDDLGELARAVYVGLAAEVTISLDCLEALTARPIRRIKLGGGGADDPVLCRMIANASGREVLAGPVEASAMGNAMAQFTALGAFASMRAAQARGSAGCDVRSYPPSTFRPTAEPSMPYEKGFS